MVGSKASPDEVSMTYLRKFYSILQRDISLETSYQDVSNDMYHCRIIQEWNEIFQNSNVRIRKPMVEKKRRERMNQSIHQLKDLIAETIQQNVAPMTRVDKADILELAVVHLSTAKQRHRKQGISIGNGMTSGYQNGYRDCAREVLSFLSNNRMLDGHVIGNLSVHLNDSFTQKDRSEYKDSIRPDANFSTPVRPEFSMEIPITPAQVSEYSPIHQISPDISTHQSSSDSSSYSGFLSSSTDSLSSGSCFIENYGRRNCEDVTSGTYGSGSSSRLVTIGDQNGDAIGHVIKDSVWRPW